MNNPKMAVIGDFNDTPDSTPLAPLIQHTDLEHMMRPLYLSGGDRRPGTYGSAVKSNKIDYILFSSALRATVSAVRVEAGRRVGTADLPTFRRSATR